ncbi:pilus assembly protein PilM [bacterium]|nr:pilus assembly protein PilM [bacterium]
MMAKTVIGLEITSNTVRAIELERVKDGIRGVGFNVIEIGDQRGLSEEDKREKQIEATKSALAGLTPRKKFKNVVTSVSSRDVRHRVMLFPQMSKKELELVVQREVKKDVTTPDEDLTFDYSTLGIVVDKGVDKDQVLIVSSGKEEVYHQTTILEKLDIIPTAISSTTTALINSFVNARLWKENDPTAIIHIGDVITTLCIFRNGVLQFSREIFTGYNEIMASLKSERPEEEGDFVEEQLDVGPASIEEIPALARIITETHRSFLYYRQQFRGQDVKRVFLCGNILNIPHLLDFIAEGLEIDAVFFKSFENIDLDGLGAASTELETLGPSFAVAVGLSLEIPSEPKINLLPTEIREKAFISARRAIYAVASAFIIIALAVTYIMINSKVKTYNLELEEEQAIFETLKPALEELAQVNAETKLHENYANLYRSLTGSEPLWTDFLLTMTNLLPESMYLESIEIRDTVTEAQKGGRRRSGQSAGMESDEGGENLWLVNFIGRVYADDQVSLVNDLKYFTDQLEKSPFLKSVELQPVHRGQIVTVTKPSPRLRTKTGEIDKELLEKLYNSITLDLKEGRMYMDFEIACVLEGMEYWNKIREKI